MTLWGLMCVACAASQPLPPRVAAALGGTPHACPACGIGTWCDTSTGQCVGASAAVPATPPSSGASPPSSEDLGPEGLRFACTTRDGEGDVIVAEDQDAAARACEQLSGGPCRCRPATGSLPLDQKVTSSWTRTRCSPRV